MLSGTGQRWTQNNMKEHWPNQNGHHPINNRYAQADVSQLNISTSIITKGQSGDSVKSILTNEFAWIRFCPQCASFESPGSTF